MFAKLPPAPKPAVPSRAAGARSPDRGVHDAEPARVTPFALSRASHFAPTERGLAGRTLAAPPENDALEGEADQLAGRLTARRRGRRANVRAGEKSGDRKRAAPQPLNQATRRAAQMRRRAGHPAGGAGETVCSALARSEAK